MMGDLREDDEEDDQWKEADGTVKKKKGKERKQ